VAPEPSASDAERNRLYLALTDLLADRANRSISLEQLLRRAAVSPPTFARQFESIDECFTAAWDEVDSELARRMQSAYESGQEWQTGLREALLAGYRYLGSEPGRARLYLDESLQVSDDLRERRRAALVRLGSLIDRGGGGGNPGDPAPGQVAEAVSGAIWHRAQQLSRTGDCGDPPTEVSQLMYLAVLPYRGAAAAEAELRRP
jgi:AcrR family transcriptional regulator